MSICASHFWLKYFDSFLHTAVQINVLAAILSHTFPLHVQNTAVKRLSAETLLYNLICWKKTFTTETPYMYILRY